MKKLLMMHFSRTWWWLRPLLHFAPIILHIHLTHWLYLFWKEALSHLKRDQKIAGAQMYQPLQGLHGFAMLFTANFALGQWIRWIINKHLETLSARYHWCWTPCKRFTDRSKVFIYGEDPRFTPRFAINCVALETPNPLWASLLSASLCCLCRLKNSQNFKWSLQTPELGMWWIWAAVDQSNIPPKPDFLNLYFF